MGYIALRLHLIASGDRPKHNLVVISLCPPPVLFSKSVYGGKAKKWIVRLFATVAANELNSVIDQQEETSKVDPLLDHIEKGVQGICLL